MSVLGVVEKATRETCPYCRKPVAVVEVRGKQGAKWLQLESHPCVKTALSDLVDVEVFGESGEA